MPVTAAKETEDVQKISASHKPKRKAPSIAHHKHPTTAESSSSVAADAVAPTPAVSAVENNRVAEEAKAKRPREEETEPKAKPKANDPDDDDEDDFLLAKLEEDYISE